MRKNGPRRKADWLTLAAGLVIAAGVAMAFDQSIDAEAPLADGRFTVTAYSQSLPGQCRDALASVTAPPTPPGYAAAKKVVFSTDAINRAFTGSDEELTALFDVIGIDRSLSDPLGRDPDALIGALAVGVAVQPSKECGAEILWIFTKLTPSAVRGTERFALITAADGVPNMWPVGAELPSGWTNSGRACSRSGCLTELRDARWIGRLGGRASIRSKRFSIARTVLSDPGVLVLDEPGQRTTTGSGAGSSASITANTGSAAGGSASASPKTNAPAGASTTSPPMKPIGAGGAKLAEWVRRVAETLGSDIGGLGTGTVGEVDGAIHGIYRSGKITDFLTFAKSALVSAGGVVTSESQALQSVQARFSAPGGPSRAVISFGPTGISIVAYR